MNILQERTEGKEEKIASNIKQQQVRKSPHNSYNKRENFAL